MNNVFEALENCLRTCDPDTKSKLTVELYQSWQNGTVRWQQSPNSPIIETPGIPDAPRLVAPKNLPKRSIHTETGFAALVHSIVHIEFNAINLALDAAHRFRHLPEAYYADWLRVAAEEAYHFSIIQQHLQTLGFKYGDFDAHAGLWEIAALTKHDVLARMALVPRVFEARGLDVTPGVMDKFKDKGDTKGVEILKIILHDEIGHVEIGSHWFHYLCDLRSLEPDATFIRLISQHLKGSIKLPLHRHARKKAGFSDNELNLLEQLSHSGRNK